MRSIPVRIFALIAAYAFVLQVLLVNVTSASHLVGNAPVILCNATPDSDQPANQDHESCISHCLIAGTSDGGLSPPYAVVATNIVSAGTRISLLEQLSAPSNTAIENPHSPRAPPLA